MNLAAAIYRLLHRHLFWCLILAYGLGAFLPQPGRWIRGVPDTGGPGGWLLKVMLGMLLLNAGLGLDPKRLVRLRERWTVLMTAIVVSVVVPGTAVLVLSCVVVTWGFSGPVQATVIGLAIVAAMPTAGSSTAWSQNAEGDMALTLGLVLGSTLLSPVTAVLLPLAVVTLLGAEALAGSALMASHAAVMLLTFFVILPAFVGMLLRRIVGEARIEQVKPYIKLVNLVNLLLLNYANASLSLPAMLSNPQPSQLAIVVLATVGLAMVTFPAAGLLARFCRVDAPQRASLFFGIGMKNNGAGLVLVSTAFPVPGPILLPIILYNIVQHLAAAVVDRFVLRAGEQNGSRTGANRVEPGRVATNGG